MTLAVDSSVWVASLLPREHRFRATHRFLSNILTKDNTLIVPATIIPEVASAIYRRTRDRTLVEKAVSLITHVPNLHVVELDYRLAVETARFASDAGLRGMDTIVVFIAKQYEAALVTLDEEMRTKAIQFVRVLNVWR